MKLNHVHPAGCLWRLIPKFLTAAILGLGFCGSAWGQGTNTLYHADFTKAELGKVPDDLLVLDGAFTVQEEGGNKFLELPGAPLDSYGVLFGPTEKDNVTAAARIFATAKGRRFPTFALGLNGISGFRLQVSPAKKQLELYRGDNLKTAVPYQWDSGQWTHLRLQLRKAGAAWLVEGKAWTEGKPEPTAWMLSDSEKEEASAGRAGVFASPFSGTPIRFDDLTVTAHSAAPAK